MFLNLPDEIIQLIYSFDSTYKKKFDIVLEEIQRFKIYQDASIYCIYDQYSQTMHSTDSLINPNWICSSFHFTKEKMEQMIQDRKLFRNKKDILEYNIDDYDFNNDVANVSLFIGDAFFPRNG